ncbi:MAG: LPXTG cell wall anchor domain-containing protein [Gaiellales bacterium]|nr:MAG: LPXTG cell wall anchor domain-containing protein [Gaiellales bacterium]
MKPGRLSVMIPATIALALVLAIGVAGAGAGQDAYDVGTLNVSPGPSVCIGGAVTVSGSGAPANTTVSVTLRQYTGGPGESLIYIADLGTAATDGSGNWSLATTIPAIVNDPYVSGKTYATTSGAWGIWATFASSPYATATSVNLMNCALPATGATSGTLALAAGGAVLLAAGAGSRLVRTRSRR